VRGQELNPPYRQDARLRAGLRAFAKAQRAIQAEDIRVARSTGVLALRAARSAFGNDLTMAVQSKINLLWRTPLLALGFQRSAISERENLGGRSRLPAPFFQGRASPAPAAGRGTVCRPLMIANPAWRVHCRGEGRASPTPTRTGLC